MRAMRGGVTMAPPRSFFRVTTLQSTPFPMPTMMIRTVAALAALLLSGCALELTGPNPADLEFTVMAAHHGEWLEHPEVNATGDAGAIRVNARLSAPSPCQQLTADADRSGSQVTLRVRITPVGEACVASIGTFEYVAVIGQLAPGSYQLRVIHEYPGTGWPSGPVLEQGVEVF
jgi:hypothetical protein